jgi:hypothetical protein
MGQKMPLTPSEAVRDGCYLLRIHWCTGFIDSFMRTVDDRKSVDSLEAVIRQIVGQRCELSAFFAQQLCP